MNKKPFFSVLIPTKNRAHLVGYAIQSVLDQTFDDFEIILADNDDGDDTRSAVEGFSDSRFKYFKTGGLNMSENWEFALEQASGQYVTVLEDKQAYYPVALKQMKSAIDENNVDVLVWNWDSYDDTAKQAIRSRYSDSFQALSSDEVLKLYSNADMRAWRYLPRMLNSCASTEVIKRIKEHEGVNRFFDELAPDLCASFYLLAFVERVGVLDSGLGLLGYMSLSNARKIATQGKAGEGYYGKSNLSSEAVKFVPVKSNRLVHNTVYSDYLRIRHVVGGRLQAYEMSPINYVKLCLNDAARNHHRGIANLEELRLIRNYCREIHLNPVQMSFLFFGYIVELIKPSIRRLLKRHSVHLTWPAENIYEALRKISQ